MSATAREQIEAVTSALVAEVQQVAGDLPPEWAGRARELAEKAIALAGRRIRGEITAEQFSDFGEDLLLWAHAEINIGANQAYARRHALIAGTVPVLLRMALNLASGGTLV